MKIQRALMKEPKATTTSFSSDMMKLIASRGKIEEES